MPRHTRQLPTVSDADRPAWLIRLRMDVFAQVPADDVAWEYEGHIYHCVRTLDDVRGHLRFDEYWHDQVTDMLHQRWGLDVDAGAFVGLHDAFAWGQAVGVLVHGIAQSRPRSPQHTPAPAPFNVGRFQRERGRHD